VDREDTSADQSENIAGPVEPNTFYSDSSTEVPVAPSVVTSLRQRDLNSFKSASSGTGFLVP
jgi:hypothetical protein